MTDTIAVNTNASKHHFKHTLAVDGGGGLSAANAQRHRCPVTNPRTLAEPSAHALQPQRLRFPARPSQRHKNTGDNASSRQQQTEQRRVFGGFRALFRPADTFKQSTAQRDSQFHPWQTPGAPRRAGTAPEPPKPRTKHTTQQPLGTPWLPDTRRADPRFQPAAPREREHKITHDSV